MGDRRMVVASMTVNAPRNETQVAYHVRRSSELKSVRNPWESNWTALGGFIEPSRLRLGSKNEGPFDRSQIIDSTGTFALRTLQSGMHSGITSPARPWFRLTTLDPDLKEFQPVKDYLALTENRMREIFQASNIYTAFHTGYGDLGLFGQSCGLLLGDGEKIVRMQQCTHGQFWIARDETGRATTLYRRFRWSVQRIVARFGLTNISQTVRTLYDNGKYDALFYVWHAVEPRMSRNAQSLTKENKRFLSNYWEENGNGQTLLEESGFDENPIIAPPWELSADDQYAVSPGQIGLGDVKMLQREQQRKLEAIDKMVRPPMTGPTSMRNNPNSLLPGSITYSDDPTGKGYRQAMEVNLRIQELSHDIRECQDRINRAMFADLFLMLANMEGIQPRNQFEIAERKEEKLLALGPVLENVQNSQLEPTIDLTYQAMIKRDMLPPPPQELQKQNLKIEYISILAQAQKAVATGGVERFAGFVGQMSAAKPEVMDKFDADQAADVYGEMLGVPPSIIVSDDKVKAIRAERAKQQQQAQQAEMMAKVAPAMNQGAQAASVLADAQNNEGGQALLAKLGMQ